MSEDISLNIVVQKPQDTVYQGCHMQECHMDVRDAEEAVEPGETSHEIVATENLENSKQGPMAAFSAVQKEHKNVRPKSFGLISQMVNIVQSLMENPDIAVQEIPKQEVPNPVPPTPVVDTVPDPILPNIDNTIIELPPSQPDIPVQPPIIDIVQPPTPPPVPPIVIPLR